MLDCNDDQESLPITILPDLRTGKPVAEDDVAAPQLVIQLGLVAVGQTMVLPAKEGCPGTPVKQEVLRAILRSLRYNL